MATITPTTTIVQKSPTLFQYTSVWENMEIGDIGTAIGVADILKGQGGQLTGQGTGGGGGIIEGSLDNGEFTPTLFIIVNGLIGYIIEPLPNFIRPNLGNAAADALWTVTFVYYRSYK
jgi:hypothetical protein